MKQASENIRDKFNEDFRLARILYKLSIDLNNCESHHAKEQITLLMDKTRDRLNLVDFKLCQSATFSLADRMREDSYEDFGWLFNLHLRIDWLKSSDLRAKYSKIRKDKLGDIPF